MLGTLAVLGQLISCGPKYTDMAAVDLRCNALINPLGVDDVTPQLGWKLTAEGRDRRQSAYRILVASKAELLAENKGDLWDSGKQTTDESQYITYDGKPLFSRTRCYWKVKVWDESGRESSWSEPALWTMGLLAESDWEAQWIGYDEAISDSTILPKPWANGMRQKCDYRPLPSPYLRKEFHINGKVEHAYVYATALGIYALYINGKRVGADYFTPGWSLFDHRVYYQTYDIAPLLQEGKNVVSVILADGWYAGTLANRCRNFYGSRLRSRVQIEVELKEKDRLLSVVTDSTWRAAYGGFKEADFQGGETYDATHEPIGWMHVGYDDASWSSAVSTNTVDVALNAYPAVPVRKTMELEPASITQRDSGVWIVDMGQNFAGWARIAVQGERGDSVVMRFAEMLNEDGSIHTRNLRTARAMDTYVLNGEGVEVWEPQFTYHGFRYIEVSGWPGELRKEHLTGIVVHSGMETTGSFECSDTIINRLHENILWSQRSNFMEVPTDCPQRDERLGWGGDVQVFATTSAYLMHVAPFYRKWLQAMRDAQYSDGGIPVTIPPVYTRVAAGWGDACVILPYDLFHHYNDTLILRENYGMMQQWLAYLDQQSEQGICRLETFGDWQFIDEETPEDLVATAYHKHCLDLVSDIARLLGEAEDAQAFAERSEEVRKAFQDTFYLGQGQLRSNAQTAYLLALAFDMVDSVLLDSLAGQLVQQLEARDSSLTTGILGTGLLLPVLQDIGETELAYHLLQKESYPSWGYQIQQGATTIWERWNGFTDSAGFYDDKTNSFNHFALGSVGEWLYASVAGIAPASPGFKEVSIRPIPGGGLTIARGVYRSMYGTVSSAWQVEGGQFICRVSVPPNVHAWLALPLDNLEGVQAGDVSLHSAEWSERIVEKDGKQLIRLGSGDYEFTAPWNHD